ncbi:hypothetical protein PghCCS26_47210 [Paenibacillus glycanilyticus]|uniref:Uncharacterized protein n=1 Tax=Paenibacillus glycanilyticus TaxID=126569 RepID=A0ABQ6NR79_9BACL|nr:hypothetical protein [Paenibacillus glycanilyticus]GMK47591.1 hypothetical protein PghCCS26_47210 [Paenibacillus glycanilyticus]
MESVKKQLIGEMVQALADQGVYNIRIGRSTDNDYLNIEWTEPKPMEETQ